ncbi:hypothetical protein Hdeb2414_s0007g00251781 [Helianthus debilis subsp. tardiflorus]
MLAGTPPPPPPPQEELCLVSSANGNWETANIISDLYQALNHLLHFLKQKMNQNFFDNVLRV